MSHDDLVIQEQMEVYGSDRQFIGEVKLARDEDFLVHRRLHRDIFIPREAVRETVVDHHRIELSITADEIDEMGWEHPPLLGEPEPQEPRLSSQRQIADVVLSTIDSIDSSATVKDAHRQMDLEGLRSLVVVEDGRPVGVMLLQTILKMEDQDTEQPVSHHMVGGLPRITPGLTLSEASERLAAANLEWITRVDNLPVVDDEGILVGEVRRDVIEQNRPPLANPASSASPDI